jgi:hypothetical protein
MQGLVGTMPTGVKSEKQTNEQKWARLNQIIDAIRDKGPMSSGDIQDLFKGRFEFTQKTRQNYLAELVALHLLVLTNGRYSLVEHCQSYKSKPEYDLAIQHSKKLLDALNGVLPLSYLHPEWFENRLTLSPKMQDQLLLVDMCKQHLLTGYTNSQIAQFENLINQKSQLAERLIEFVPKIEKDHLLEYVASFETREYAVPKKYRGEVERLVALLGSERFKALKEVEDNYVECFVHVSKELKELMIRMEHGRPLLGVCDFCPKVRIRDEH